MSNDARFLTGLMGVGLLTLTVLFLIYTLFPNRAEYYSLIVTDAYQQQWVVDYNLTLPDCVGMKASPAAECSLQPEGKI